MTIGKYLDRWMRDVEGTMRESTHQRYGYAVGPHLKLALGRIKLKDLNPAQVRWFYRDRLDSGLSPASVHKLHVVLHKALKAAVADGLIPRNAAAGLKLPRLSREQIDPLSGEEARRLLKAARGNRLEALYVLALSTGMRQGELPSLKWEDVDLEGGVLRVRRTLTKTGKVYTIGEPKTKNSRRVIRLTGAAVGALRAHLARQLEEMETKGSLYRGIPAIFAREFGDVLHFTKPPLVVQRLLFGALGAIARLFGYRGSYPKYTDASEPDLSSAKGVGPPSAARVLAGALALVAPLLLTSLLLLRWRAAPRASDQ